jgi:hypothetical protein
MATFADTLLACVHVPGNTRLIATCSKKYSVADAQFGADSYEIDLSSPITDLRKLGKEKKLK